MHALWILLSTGTAPAVEPVPDAGEPAPESEHWVREPAPMNRAVRPGGLVPDALEGTWWVVDDDRDASIEQLAAELPFYLRPIARTRLRAATFPCDKMRIEDLQDQISITCDDLVPAVGPPSETVEYGEGVRLTMMVSGDSLVQTFTRKDGVRRNVYTTGDGGLRLEVTVRSPRLPRELVYQRTFTRDGEPAAPGVTEVSDPAAPAGS
jgi:hypothetical protein